MPPLFDWLSDPLWARLTLTLLHFLWQGCALVVVFLIVNRILPILSPRGRYAAQLVALTLMLLCLPVTFTLIELPLPEVVVASESPTVSSLPAREVSSTPAPSKSQDAFPPSSIDMTVEAELVTPTVFTGQTWIMPAWLAGVAALTLRLLVGFVWTIAIRFGRLPVDAALTARTSGLAADLGIRRVPRVWLSRRVTQAVVVGYMRPMILLPVCWVTELPPSVLEAVIAHELAHIRRWDVWVILLQRVAETLLFYHPAVWWLSRQLSRSRELCCDSTAVRVTGSPQKYASALERIATYQWLARTPALTPTFGGPQMELLPRIRHILSHNDGSPLTITPRRRASGVAAVTLLGLIGVSGAVLAYESDDPESTDAPSGVVERSISAKPGAVAFQKLLDRDTPEHALERILNLFQSGKEETASSHESSKLVVVIYPVADLLTAGFTLNPPKQLDDQDAETKAWSAEASGMLTNLITENIEPESWEANGGDGRIARHESTMSLVILQTREGHKKTSAFLSHIRKLLGGPAAAGEVEENLGLGDEDALRGKIRPIR